MQEAKSAPLRKKKPVINRKNLFWSHLMRDAGLYLLLAPAILYVLIFLYRPMVGVLIAFEDYKPTKGIFGSAWVGLKWFNKFLTNYNFTTIFLNTLILSLYSLIDPEVFTLSEAELFSKLNQEPCVVSVTQMWDINDSISNPQNNEDYDYYQMVSAYEGKDPVFFRNPLPGTVRAWGMVTSACKYPEVAVRWLDYWFDPDNSIESIEGPIGVRVLENDDGTLYVRTPPEGMSVAEDRFANCRAGILAATPSIYANRLKLPSTAEKVAFVEEYCHPYADPDPMMPVFYTAEEAEEIGTMVKEMNDFITGSTAKMIRDNNVDEAWDAYVSAMNSQYLPTWLAINQAAYDRYMGQ